MSDIIVNITQPDDITLTTTDEGGTMSINVTLTEPAPIDVTLSQAQGLPGPAGEGVPAGGTTGQVLTKIDGDDYNTEWTTGGGGVPEAPIDGQAYVRKSAAWAVAAGGGDELTSNKVSSLSGSSTNVQYTGAKLVYDQLALKVDKVSGKELSTNDFTDALETKLNGIAAGAEVNINADWNASSGDAQILNKPTISGSNTGDETTSTIKTKLGAADVDSDGYLTFTDWGIFYGKQNALTFGIANTNAVQINAADVADNDYAKFTASGLEGRSYAEVKTDLSINNVDNTSDVNKPISTAHQNLIDATKEPTGFVLPESVIVTYNSATQRVTLTGTPTARYKGALVSALVSGWASDPHPDVTGHVYYLYYNGSAFVWNDNAFPGFDQLLIAFAFYRASAPFAVRECHGLQTWQCHQTDHYNIGTYRTAGGDITNIVPASTTADNRRPIISGCTMFDEDLQTINAALTSKLYSQRFMTLTNTINYTLGAADIVPLLSANPYYNAWDGSAWIQTLMPSNSVMTVWLYEVPVTADAGSQAIRHVFVQGQSITQASSASAGALTTARNTEKAKTSLELNLGDPNVVSAEYVLISKFIIVFTTNWYISDVITITGNKANQTGTAAGNFLSSVATSAPITGTGLVSDPVTMAAATASVNGYATSTQITKLDGIAAGANNYSHPNHSGDVTSAGDGAQTIANSAVTLAKMANLTHDTVIGRVSSGDGVPESLTGANIRTISATPEAVGFAKITVGTTQPSTPGTGDLWIDTN